MDDRHAAAVFPAPSLASRDCQIEDLQEKVRKQPSF